MTDINPRELWIFIDGSETNTGTGTRVFSEDHNIKMSMKLEVHITVFQAECVGIIFAADALKVR